MGIKLCNYYHNDIRSATNASDITEYIEALAQQYSKRLDYYSYSDINPTKLDYYISVETNLYTLLNIMRYKSKSALMSVKDKLFSFVNTIELENIEKFNRESFELEQYLRRID